MKKKIAIILVLTIMLTSCMAMLCSCVNEDPEPRDVEIELINPTTGEVIKRDDTIDLPEEKTPIEVRIKDKETGEYLTDDDLPENTVKGSYTTSFNILDKEGHLYFGRVYEYWPTMEDIDRAFNCNYYEMQISFDCRPDDPINPREFKRKYKMKTDYVRFYINRP